MPTEQPAASRPANPPAPGLVRELPHASVRRNLRYALLGNGLLNVCRFGVIGILANFASAQAVGSFYFAAIALSAPIVMFCGLELRAAFMADVQQVYPFGAYRALRQVGMGLAGLVLLAVIGFQALREPWELALLMALVCGGRVVFQLAEVEWGLMQRHERFDLIARSNAIRGLMMIAPFALLVPTTYYLAGPEQTTIAVLVAGAIYVTGWTGVWYFHDRGYVLAYPEAAPRRDPALLRRLAARAFPMGLVILILALCESVPAWYLERTPAARAAVGYYGALKIITLGASFLIVQVGNAAGNRLAITYQSDLAAFTRLAVRLTLVAVALGGGLLAAAYLVGRPFLDLIYPADYAAYYPEFVILVGAQSIFLVGSIFGFVTTHMGRFWVQVPVQLTILAVTVIGSHILIPSDPVRGAAWVVVIRALVQASLYFLCVVGGVRARRAA